MQTRYPVAAWRPLGPETEPSITPRILVFHTMVGGLRGTDTMFRAGGYQGVESTFGVGGPWDGAALDGVVWQWQDTGHQADAQAGGNNYCDSVETSDGGNPNHPWSTKQLAALVALTVWWCRATGNPCRLVRSTGDRGIGYHRQFAVWNPDNHSCPGDVRQAQLLNYVIPTAARELAHPNPNPPAPQEADMQSIYVRPEPPAQPGDGYYAVTPNGVHGVSRVEFGILETDPAHRLVTVPRAQWQALRAVADLDRKQPVDVKALAEAIVGLLPAGSATADEVAQHVVDLLASRLQS